MVRSAQHAHGRPRRGAVGAATDRKPRRPSARGFSANTAAMAAPPARAPCRRRAATQRRASRGAGVMSTIAKLKIRRGSPGDQPRWEPFDLPFEPGQSVLDGLRWLRINKDPSLAMRFSCINANACKECMIQLDGETVYACTARLEPREMTLAPLPNKNLIRDLVTEIAPPSERVK